MMKRYIHVTEGQIDIPPGLLPRQWKHRGAFTKPTNLESLGDVQLAKLGWLPVDEIRPPFDPETEALEGPVVELLEDRGTETYTKRPLNADEIAERDRANRKKIKNDPDEAKVVTHADMNRLLDALREKIDI